jgi:hypothetical protein
MDSGERERIDYESALRVIGRHLDSEPTYNMSLQEGDDGFTVRSQQSKARADTRIIQFTWDRIRDLVVFHVAGRGCARRQPRHAGIWENFPNGHEDFFRALGHRLDNEGGTGLQVDEVTEGVSIVYSRPNASGTGEAERSSAVLVYSDIEVMLEAARRRRNRGEQAAMSGVTG